ncbi:MAG: metallophosphoesterase family protein [Corallococcus sp.]|nr:metallophosphoesterase family protein [Corallococcus sp.]MCM1359583.1 metallophosphoesterase family protein [Corallococcus sp.]MCM1395175.1 metallophosphoesterase family protein [Corallococcus sp.]
MTSKFVAKTLSIIFVALLIVAAAAFPAAAQAVQVVNPNQAPRMITVCLYGDTTTQMAFNWNTIQYAGSDVLIVEKSDAQGFESASVKKFVGTATKSTVAGDGYIHRAVASHLTPATEYIFKVGDCELQNFSEQGSFKTSGEGAFTFLHVSDPQAYEQRYYENYGKMLASASSLYNFSFVALTGDIVNNSWAEHTPQLEQWEWALTDRFDFMGHTPVAAVAGNHEAATDDFYSRFTYDVPQGSDTSTGCYYSFNYSNAHFVCLNTNDTTNKTTPAATGLSAAQYDWIKADLEANKNSEWLIVLMHKGIYDSGDHCQNAVIDSGSEDYDIAKIREQLAPLFTEYGVDLVLQGHDHLYSKSAPIVANTVNGVLEETAEEQPEIRVIDGAETETYLSPKGTLYLNSGSASGSKYYTPNVNYDPDLIVKTNNPNALMYTAITVDGDSIVVQTYTMDNAFNSVPYHTFAILHGEAGVNGGLLAWQIALIAVGCVLVTAGVTLGVVFALKRKRSEQK